MSTPPSPVTSSPRLGLASRWQSADLVRVTVTGEIDLATAEEFRAALLGAVIAGFPRRIEVDLAGVTFLDCSGLSVLLGARGAADRVGCRLGITAPPPLIRRVLEATGVLGILTSEPVAREHGDGAARIGAGGDLGA